jgi:hypothetical protein
MGTDLSIHGPNLLGGSDEDFPPTEADFHLSGENTGQNRTRAQKHPSKSSETQYSQGFFEKSVSWKKQA